MKVRQVKPIELWKIAALVAVLVTLPVTISLFRIQAFDVENIQGVSLGYLIVRLLFIFLFSFIVLQFNANLKYRFPEGKYPILVQQILVVMINIGLYFGTLAVLNSLYSVFTGKAFEGGEQKFLYFIFSIVHIILLFISRILRLGIIRQDSMIENERLQQQNLQKELSALKNQLNPHFLFNSLNTLNSLIRENSEATMFVNKLSHMYRYILQSSDRDLVCLKEELKFLESYSFLIKTRFRQQCFAIDMDISPEHLQMEIPPMALQLLVENAVKHNEMSKNCPLQLKIYSEGNSLVVQNRYHPRTTEVDSTGNGLLNLDKRYFLLRKEKITIQQNENLFTVKLPLIPMA